MVVEVEEVVVEVEVTSIDPSLPTTSNPLPSGSVEARLVKGRGVVPGEASDFISKLTTATSPLGITFGLSPKATNLNTPG